MSAQGRAGHGALPPVGPLNERPGGFVPRPEVQQMLLQALAGVDVGVDDRRIVEWLAGFNTEAVTVASLIRRAWQAGVQTGRGERLDEAGLRKVAEQYARRYRAVVAGDPSTRQRALAFTVAVEFAAAVLDCDAEPAEAVRAVVAADWDADAAARRPWL